MKRMRWWIMSLLALATTPWAVADHFALGAPFGGGPFDVYAISATGEITLHDRTEEISLSEMAAVDPGGRFFLSRHFPHDIDLYRIHPDRTVSHESFFDISDREIDYPLHLALAQDGRMFLAPARDTDVQPLEASWETFKINNRLQIVRTGHDLNVDVVGRTAGTSWCLSGPHDGGYTGVILDFQLERLVVLSITEEGMISDSGQRITAPAKYNHPLEISDDGSLIMAHSQSHMPTLAAFSVSQAGEVALAGTGSPLGAGGGTETSILPDQSGVLLANEQEGLSSIALLANGAPGSLLDSDSPGGFSIVEALDVSRDGTVVIVDDQSGLGQFSIYTYSLAADGTLTRTGGEHPKPYKLSTLDFIPDLAVPTLPGDANLDGRVDAADVVFLVNEAMPDEKPILLPPNFANADLDGDVDVDQADLEALVDLPLLL